MSFTDSGSSSSSSSSSSTSTASTAEIGDQTPQEAGYEVLGGHYFNMDLIEKMPTESVLPTGNPTTPYKTGEVPALNGQKYPVGTLDKNVQGFKLHVAIDQRDAKNAFNVLKDVLKDVAHKFIPFDRINKDDEKTYDMTKFCTIYPESLDVIEDLVPKIEEALERFTYAHLPLPPLPTATSASSSTTRPTLVRTVRQPSLPTRAGPPTIRPLAGGVPTDQALGDSGFVFCRYGTFSGPMANKERVYNPIDKSFVTDDRSCPFPQWLGPLPPQVSAMRPKGGE